MTDDSTSSPPTPSFEGAGGGEAPPANGTDETSDAWALVIECLPRRDPKIRNPMAYVKTLREQFPHPRDAGFAWIQEELDSRERRTLKGRILEHKGQQFAGGSGTWIVDPHGDGVITPEGRVQVFGGLSLPSLRTIVARLEAR